MHYTSGDGLLQQLIQCRVQGIMRLNRRSEEGVTLFLGLVMIREMKVYRSRRNIFYPAEIFFPVEDKGNSRQSMDAFIGGSCGEVDGIFFEVNLISAQTADAIHHQSLVILFCQLSDFREWVQQAGCCFMMHHGDHFNRRIVL